MTTEREKATRWWRFDTRDLLLLTALVAASLTALRVIDSVWPSPAFVNAACLLPITCAVIGGLAKHFWGGITGALAGGILAAVIVVAGWLMGH